MNPLHLEEMMVSSFSTSSIVFRTGSLHPEYSCTLRRHPLKEFRATEEIKPRHCVLYPSRRSRNALVAISVEDGCAWTRTRFFDHILVFPGPLEQYVGQQRHL